MKVVINRKFGGFDLSQEALKELQKRLTPDSEIAIARHRQCDPDNPEARSRLFVLWDGEVSTRSNPCRS